MDADAVLRVLGDRTRFQIIEALLAKRLCVRALAAKIGLTEATISEHLKRLREVGLVTGEKRGYFMHYEVNRQCLREASEYLARMAESNPPAPDGCRKKNHAGCCCRKSSGSKKT